MKTTKIDASVLRQRIQELAAQHGSLRSAARVLRVDVAYMSNLKSGRKNNPSDILLKRMGLYRTITFCKFKETP